MENFNIEEITNLLYKIGDFQQEGFRNLDPGEIEIKQEKDRQSFLTKYDTQSEKMLFDFVASHYPSHSFLGEESGNTLRDPDIYWIVDPIDGTTNFTIGLPFWGISLAIWVNHDPVYSFIYFPSFKDLYFAQRGKGAFLNNKPIHTSRATEYSRNRIVATMSETHRYRRLKPGTKHRILGSVIANLTGVASGKFLACFMRAKIWDIAAGILLVEEAGGVVNSVPDYHDVDLASYDCTDPVKIEIHAKANKTLPDFETILVKERSPGLIH